MIPQLRFPEFTDEWQAKKLGDVIEFKNGKPFEEYVSENGQYNLITIDSVDIEGNLKSKFKKVTKSDGSLRRDDIVTVLSDIAHGKLLGLTSLIPEDNHFVLNQRMGRLRPRHNDSPHFISHYINTDQKYYRKRGQGTSQRHIYERDINQMSIDMPIIQEQQKIADFLGGVDSKLTSTQTKVAAMHEYKKGVMQALFSGKLRFKDENGNPYPDWEEKRLGDIASRVTQKNGDNFIHNVLTNSATAGVVSQSDYFDKNIANQNNLAGYYVVSKDDFVYNPRISQSAPVGPIKRNNLEKGVMSPLYTVFRFNDGNKLFFEMYFNTRHWHEYMRSVANSGARHDRMNITTGDFYNLPVPFPCPEEQQKIADFLSALDDKIKLEEAKLASSKEFKKALLQRMFV